MTAYVALLRAVNVGGTGKLPMTDLKSMCEAIGLTQVQTYIASGNVIFRSEMTETEVKATLEESLETYARKPVSVLVRTAAEMAAVLGNNPFPSAAPNRVVAIFLDKPPAPEAKEAITGQNEEEIRWGQREIYVHYGSGMADSQLKIVAAESGTARNMNTVAKLAEMAAQ